jgi:hypothetical protein
MAQTCRLRTIKCINYNMYLAGDCFGLIQLCVQQCGLGKLQLKKFLKIVGALFLLGMVASAIKGFNGSSQVSNTAKSGDQANVAQAVPTIQLPDGETTFINIVQKGQEGNKTAENDLQKGGVRAAREKGLCSALSSLDVNNWIGEVSTLSSNTDGKGVLAIKIAPDVYVQTWNNAASDIMDNTLIEPSTALFSKASQLKEGQTIKFSGSFFKSSEETVGCLTESSLTLDGTLSEPEFVFRFSDISTN